MTRVRKGDVFYTRSGCQVVVLDYVNSEKIYIEYQDSHRYKTYTSTRHLKNGNIKNPYSPSLYGVGYIGSGSFRSKINGKQTVAYASWKRMLERVYDERMHIKSPTYKRCSVCNEWYNFQNFAEWFYQQPNAGRKGFDLDKDLLIVGNTEYSEKACSLVPKKINNLMNSSHISNSSVPEGVRRKGRKYQSFMSRHGRQVFLGTYDSLEAARKSYVTAKQEYVVEIAELYKNDIHPVVYNNLINWDFENGSETRQLYWREN